MVGNLLVMGCIGAMAAGGAHFEAAAGKVEITPDHAVYLAGYGSNRRSAGVHDPLWARCLVMKRGSQAVALVSCDLLAVPRWHAQRIRALIRSVPPERVLIGATHTHSGPDTYGQWGPNLRTSGVDQAWMDAFIRKVAALVDDTAAHLRPAHVRFGSTRDVHGCSKNIRIPQVLDTELSAMQVLDEHHTTIATLVNYACHPEILDNHWITSDFPNWLRARVEERLGGIAIYMNGAQGGMVTADIRNEKAYPPGEAWPEAVRIGTTLADKAVEALQAGTTVDDPSITFGQRRFWVPLENPVFRMLIANKIFPDFLDRGRVPTEVSRFTIGPAEFLTFPGEVLPNIGLYLKRRMTGTPRFELGLTGDALGYILTPEDYGLPLYRYESSVSIGPQMGRAMENNLLALMGAEHSPGKGP
ncbi:MAG: neutral/alkaline non-lysosomal ceramidase N-terminal domain-containing protein [Chthonomonadales bacterium]